MKSDDDVEICEPCDKILVTWFPRAGFALGTFPCETTSVPSKLRDPTKGFWA